MKNLIAVFCFGVIALNVNADERYAHEYSSEDDEQHEPRRKQQEWYESERYEQRSIQVPRYQQNYQQLPPIQIYMQPPQNFRPHDKQTREDNRWRQRREELQQMPQTPYFENQFDRDDTHW
ncbi:MAG: hypothetical protein PHN45_10605 [Methylococcales bacterium]|nr:hypothetical protein [Methylococcales bacterium]MDD5755187.1 hypothetical protein [Methylococcales bacterium]